MQKIKTFKNGASVVIDGPSFPSGMYKVVLRDPAFEVYDSIRCDSYKMAREYQKAFEKIGRGLKK